jgi:glycosyltransferase involved in cell wall biosynthesis
MPVFNAEAYLRQGLESILNQTFADFELIVINDGSTDETRKILESYADSRLVVKHRGHEGLVASLNIGFNAAKGEYIARQDSDDVSCRDRLAKQVDFLDERNDIGIVGTQMQIVDEEGRWVESYEVPCSHSMIVWNLLFGRSFAHPSVMIRASLAKGAGGYKTAFTHAEDLELWMRLVGNTQFANLPETLVIYRTHPRSISQEKKSAQRANVLRLRQQFISRVVGREIELEVLEWVGVSQSPWGVLSEWQIRRVIDLVLEVHRALRDKLFITDEDEDVSGDVLDRIVTAARRTGPSHKGSRRAALGDRCRQGSLRNALRRIAGVAARHGSTARGLVKRLINAPSMQCGCDEGRYAVVEGGTATRSKRDDHPRGVTVIILSYERRHGLAALLRSLRQQKLDGLDIELILCNNSAGVQHSKSLFSKIGRILREFNDIKILNSSYNWRCGIRYAMASMAKFKTILFLDDDVLLAEPNFVRYMFDVFQKLTSVDILSCWTTLWVDCGDTHLSTVSMTFTTPGIAEVTESDTCGPGVCMFNREILNPNVMKAVIFPEFPKADDMGFSLIAALEHGSHRYYLPSYGMLKIHKQYTKAALNRRTGHYDDLYRLYKAFVQNGYQPVLSRMPSRNHRDTPEWKAVKMLPLVRQQW